jgi:FkbM family methyltransferase
VRTPQGEVPLTIFNTSLSHTITQEIIEGRSYPRIPFVQSVQTIVDVGANVGVAALFFALSYPQAQLFAFEPCPETYQLLCQNLSAFPQIHPFGFGLLDRDGTLPLYLSRVDPVTHSLGRSDFNTEQRVDVQLRNARQVMAEQHIHTIDVLKIDTEGCEVPILQALAELVPRVQVLYVEFHDEDDRLAIDAMLRGTHILYHAKLHQPHRGELCYVAYASFPSRAALEQTRIRRVTGN